MKFIDDKKNQVLKKLVDSVSLYDRDCAEWQSAHTYYNGDGLNITFSIGPVDRGPRIDHGGGEDGDEWLDDHQLEELEESYYKANKSKLERLKSLVEEEFSSYQTTFPEPKIDYGEKGDIMLLIYVSIKGKFFNWGEEKLWADYSGAYDKEKIMLQTPDVERFFDSEEEIISFLKTFNYTDGKDPF